MAADRNRSLTSASSADGIKRSLVLPGGGMRLSYQAGAMLAMQEAGISFQHMDATSGGSLNLSMLLSGLSPLQMCQRWRSLNMADSIAFLPLENYLDIAELEASGSGDGFVESVYPHLGIDCQRIRQFDDIPCTYNVLDFGEKQVRVLSNHEMDEQLLLAGMSLPGVFPPLRRDGDILLDTGFLQDANVAAAVRQGAEEIWLIWGLGNSPEYRGGALRLYVQMLEMAANGALNRDMQWIDEINQGIAHGYSPYGQQRAIRVHVIKPFYPLPLDPDLYLGKVDHATLVEMGYADAKQYLQRRDEFGADLRSNVTAMKVLRPGVRFQEQLAGNLSLDGDAAAVELNLTVHVEDLDQFCADAIPQARVTGRLTSAALGGEMLVAHGVFQLLRDSDAGAQRRLVYELQLEDGEHRLQLFAQRILHDDAGFDMWSDISRLQMELFSLDGQSRQSLAKGELQQGLKTFGKVLTSVRATGGGGVVDDALQVARFGRFLMGEIYDSYHS
ncbi:MAG: patatin-like phospholipase family protein [Gammaproteobacteria bacterium]|nr:patatin-like phospholipase family protein [Gammaproteobacteria bacterium]